MGAAGTCAILALISICIVYAQDSESEDEVFKQLLTQANYLRSLGQHYEAALAYGEALVINPNHANAFHSMGDCLGAVGDISQALSAFVAAARLNPTTQRHIQMVSRCHRLLSQPQEAETWLRRGLHRVPPLDGSDLYFELGVLLFDQHKPERSLDYYDMAVQLNAQHHNAFQNMAAAYYAVGRYDDAIVCFNHSYWIMPSNSGYARNYAMSLEKIYRHDEAVEVLERSVLLDPNDRYSFCRYVDMKRKICIWDDWEDDMAAMEMLMEDDFGEHPCLDAMPALAYPLLPETQRALADKNAALLHKAVPPWPVDGVMPLQGPTLDGGSWDDTGFRRVRVGYYSSDLLHHPVGHLMYTSIEKQDRSMVEVFVYSLAPDDDSKFFKRVFEGAEHHYDISRISNAEAYQLIRSHQLHILLTLNGYTDGSRMDLLTPRLAPVQAVFLGYMGTLGGDLGDFYVVDKICSPPEYDFAVSERMLYMPDTFMVTDHTELHATLYALPDKEQRTKMRRQSGLPPDPFIFCNFNQMYKIDPEMFDVWMRILSRTDNTILWLQKFPEAAVPKLRARAERLGVDADRLFFTHKMPQDQHVIVKSLADLHLDTSIFNAHSTAVEHLWAGVPGITRPGYTMAGRVGASLALNVGTGALVVNSIEDYEEMAVRLAQDAGLYQSVREGLRFSRHTQPLFLNAEWVTKWDRSLRLMWEARYWTWREGEGEPTEPTPEGDRPADTKVFHVVVANLRDQRLNNL